MVSPPPRFTPLPHSHLPLLSLIRKQSGIQEVKANKPARMGQNKLETRAREKHKNHLQLHRHTHAHIRISMKAQNQKLLYIYNLYISFL